MYVCMYVYIYQQVWGQGAGHLGDNAVHGLDNISDVGGIVVRVVEMTRLYLHAQHHIRPTPYAPCPRLHHRLLTLCPAAY